MQHSTVMILILIAAAIAGVITVQYVCKQEAFEYSRATQTEFCDEQAQLIDKNSFLQGAGPASYTNCMRQVDAHPQINMPAAYVTVQQQPQLAAAYPSYSPQMMHELQMM